MDAVEDVKNRLAIEDVVGEYVELKRSGRNFKALSPFNSEKTPSFMVSPEKQIWHDFSSGKGGNVFSFIMEVEGVDFKEALEILARKAGVDLSLYRKSNTSNYHQKDKVLEVLDLSAKYYQQTLFKNEDALEYVIKQRHFNKQTLTDFKIGFAPSSGTALADFLNRRGLNEATIKMSGLCSRRYDGKLRDMFRGRIMIPLMDPQGAVIGFTARILDNNIDAPKYINTPQTSLYDKSRHVFGLNLAKDSIRKTGFAVIVEGNLDVISSHQVGVKNVVATAGTALTIYHLKSIQRFTNDIRLSFDQDKAGLAAAERAIQVAQGAGVQLSIITIPSGKDPDELINKDPKLWTEAIYSPMYAMDWLMNRYQKIYDVSTARGKKLFSDVMMVNLMRIEDKVEQDHYLIEMAKITNVSTDSMRAKLESLEKDRTVVIKKKPRILNPTSEKDQYKYEDQLLSLLVEYPITRRLLQTDADKLIFSTPERQRVYEYVEANPHVAINDNIPEDLKDVEDYVKILTLKAEELYNGFDSNERLIELRDLTRKMTAKHQKQEKTKLAVSIREAEESGDEARVQELLEKFNELIKDN